MAHELGYSIDLEDYLSSPRYKGDEIRNMAVVSYDPSVDTFSTCTPKVMIDAAKLRGEYYAYKLGLLSHKQKAQLFDASHYKKILDFTRDATYKTDLRKGLEMGFLLFAAADILGKS